MTNHCSSYIAVSIHFHMFSNYISYTKLNVFDCWDSNISLVHRVIVPVYMEAINHDRPSPNMISIQPRAHPRVRSCVSSLYPDTKLALLMWTMVSNIGVGKPRIYQLRIWQHALLFILHCGDFIQLSIMKSYQTPLFFLAAYFQSRGGCVAQFFKHLIGCQDLWTNCINGQKR